MLAVLAACVAFGAPPFTVPDNGCTRGAWVHKTKADVCDGKTARPKLRAAERRAILTNYGFTTFSERTGELDHRVPLVLGGVTDRRNVWPEEGPATNNPKDRLEQVILRRVCQGKPHPMRVSTAIKVFLVDWRMAYSFYVPRSS